MSVKKPHLVNPHTLVAQKVEDKVIYRRFEGEGVEFFLIIFLKYQFNHFQLSFFRGFFYQDHFLSQMIL